MIPLMKRFRPLVAKRIITDQAEARQYIIEQTSDGAEFFNDFELKEDEVSRMGFCNSTDTGPESIFGEWFIAKGERAKGNRTKWTIIILNGYFVDVMQVADATILGEKNGKNEFTECEARAKYIGDRDVPKPRNN